MIGKFISLSNIQFCGQWCHHNVVFPFDTSKSTVDPLYRDVTSPGFLLKFVFMPDGEGLDVIRSFCPPFVPSHVGKVVIVILFCFLVEQSMLQVYVSILASVSDPILWEYTNMPLSTRVLLSILVWKLHSGWAHIPG